MSVKRDQFTEMMKKDMYSYLWEAYPEIPPRYEEIFEVVKSNAAYEMFTSAIGLGELLEKPEMEDIQADTPMESYTIVCKNRAFARSVTFSKESMEDAQKAGNLVATVTGSWGKQLPRTKEKFYAQFFNYGAYTAGNDVFNNTISNVVSDPSGNFIYDGQPFFSTAHPDKVGNTYSNYMASTSLTYDNLKTAYTTYTATNNRDERGGKIELEPNVLLIPRGDLRFTAQEILDSEKEPGVFDNTTNVLRNIIQPIEWAYLDDFDGWFLGKLKAGLMATDRSAVELDFYMNEQNKSYTASVYTRFGGCVTNWKHWISANISTS